MSSVRKYLNESELLKSLHGPFFPSEVRSGENIKASIECEDLRGSEELDVWRISPLGIELIYKSHLKLKPGARLGVTIGIGGQTSKMDGVVVEILENSVGRQILGIRLVITKDQKWGNEERRRSKRWLTTEQFLPSGMAPNPAKFNDFIFFRVKDMSSDGLQIVTSLRNKFILVGMTFDSSISFPMCSQVRCQFTVKNIRIISSGSTEQLSIGVEFTEKTTDLMDAIGQYVAQFSDLDNLEDLHREGLSPSTISNAVQFSYVKSEEEYQEVLRLRYEAYKTEGKLSPNARIQDMADIFDIRSRIVIGKIGGKVIATGRLTFNNHDQPLEQEQYVDWSETLPRRDQSVEIMRLCTHPKFRGSDLLVVMFKFMATAVAQSKREWVILNTTEKYLPMYQRMGGKKTGISFNFKKFNNKTHYILVGHVQSCLIGKGMNPLAWNYVYGDLMDYINKESIYQLSLTDKVRLSFYRAMKPISQAFISLHSNPKRLESLKEKIANG